LEFELALPFLAVVGPNNSGKSTLLKLFQDFGPLLESLATDNMAAIRVGLGSEHVISAPQESERWFTKGESEGITLTVLLPKERALGVAIESGLDKLTITDFVFELPRNSKSWRLIGLRESGRRTVLDDVIGNKAAVGPITELSQVKWHCDVTARGRERLFKLAASHPSAFVRVHFDATEAVKALEVLRGIKLFGTTRSLSHEIQGSERGRPIGSSFVSNWERCRDNSRGEALQEACKRVERKVSTIFDLGHVRAYTRKLDGAMCVDLDDETFQLAELGNGVSEAIYTLSSVALSETPVTLILIDEPENHLHPAKQSDLLHGLKEFASGGVVFATHSLPLARQMTDEVLVLNRKGNSTICKNLKDFDTATATPVLSQLAAEMGISYLSASGYKNLLVVEGVEDIEPVKLWLRMLGKDKSTVVIQGGGPSIQREESWSGLCTLGMDVFVLLDSEVGGDPTTVRSRQEFKKKHAANDRLSIHVTKRTALENYFTQSALNKVYPGGGAQALTAVQSPKTAVGWKKGEEYGRIAEAMTKEELLDPDNDVGQFLNSLPS